MFTLDEKLVVFWPVVICTPRDGGFVTDKLISAQYEIISNTEFSAIYKNGGNDENLLRRVLVGWDKMVDLKGNPLQFTVEARDTYIQRTYVRNALAAGYMECSSGREAARKN